MPDDQKSRAGQGKRVRETIKDRTSRQKKERLEKIRDQVKDGSLVIRKMTPEERDKYPPRQPLKKKAKRRAMYRA